MKLTKKEQNKYIKLYQTWSDANNFVILCELPYKDESRRKRNKEKLESVMEFKNFNKDNIKEEYLTTLKTIKRFLIKNNIMTKENIEGYCNEKLQPKMKVRYSYFYKNMNYTFEE